MCVLNLKIKDNNGRLFEFENTFFQSPKKIGFVRLWQIGELSTEPGYEMMSHLNPCYEITYVVSGRGIFYSDGEAIQAKPGDIHIISKGKIHRIVADADQSLRFAYIAFEFINDIPEDIKQLADVFHNISSVLIKDTGEVRMLIYMLINEMYSKPVLNDMMIECFVKQTIIQVYRLLISEKNEIFLPETSQNTIGKSIYSVIRYIDKNIYSITSMQQIADALGYSQSYISHLFKEKLGTTMQNYVSLKKIEASLDLLKYEKNTITQVATALNYESVQSFGKVFKRVMGCTPSKYQQLLKMNKE